MADENTMLRGCRTTCTLLPEDPVPRHGLRAVSTVERNLRAGARVR